jgi:hypothetical protein
LPQTHNGLGQQNEEQNILKGYWEIAKSTKQKSAKISVSKIKSTESRR